MGPVLLAIGILVLIGISVDCCVRASKEDPLYYERKGFDSVESRLVENAKYAS